MRTRVVVIDLARKLDKNLAIIFGHLTYSASKLWNVANYEVDKSSRVHRSLYVCKHCGSVMNADTNGTFKILKKLSPDPMRVGAGVLASPVRLRLVG